MKTYKKNLKYVPVLICMAGLLAFLSSCQKHQLDYVTTAPVTGVTFIQASSDEPPLDLFIGGGKVNKSFIHYGETINNFTISPGKNSVTFSSNVTGLTVLSDTINFVENAVYSMFLANKATQPEILLLTDTIGKPTSGNANIRFVNLSPDAPAVDLVVKGGAVLVSNKSFKGHSSFAPIPGNVIYTIEVHQAGTSTVLASLSNINLNNGFVYTFWFYGLATATTPTDKLTLDVINNAYFQ
ncbi:MAG TPA: DUF4397 domain-containing protein [Mucilaginibacter sp.]|jgi:hypothetical protein